MAEQRPVLLVEDDPDDVELTLLAFARHGLRNRVVVARDGSEALELLLPPGGSPQGRKRPVPSLVLLDLKLPKVDGLEVLAKLRRHDHTRALPVVVFTSSDQESDVRRSYELGASSYVVKPREFAGLVSTIRSLAVYWMEVNRLPGSSRDD